MPREAAHGSPPISVVVPVRDEEATLREVHRRLREVLPPEAEIIVVDDGSRDGSRRVLAEIAGEDPGVVAIGLPRALGKSHALAVGFVRARGKLVATIDADLQEDPRDIVRLASRLGPDGAALAGVADSATDARTAPGELDLVTGRRSRRRDPLPKVIGSRLFNAAVRAFAGVPFRDVNCGLKVMRREVAEAIPLETGYHRFIPLLAHWKGFRVGEVEIEHSPRRHGRSRYGGEKVLHGVVDLLVLLFLERFEHRPGRFFVSVGALLFLAGFAISLYLTALKVVTGTIQSRYPLLTLGVLLLVVGAQIVSTGFLAELVARRRREEVAETVRVEELRPPAAGAARDEIPVKDGGTQRTARAAEDAEEGRSRSGSSSSPR